MADSYGACSSVVISRSVRPPVRSWTWRISRSQVAPSRLPCTKARSSRLSGSTAVWSHSSPRSRSRGSDGSHAASFLATKPHFSSAWTSRVEGGKAHEFVVEPLGMGPGEGRVPRHGVLIDPDQAAGDARPAALAKVLEDGEGLVVGQSGLLQDRALALGEGALTGAAVDHADPPALAAPAT